MTERFDIVEVSLADICTALAEGRVTSSEITENYLARISAVDPKLNSVLSLNPRAFQEAREADERRDRGNPRGRLDGVPVLIKDNIDVQGLVTTAGSLALVENMRVVDAPVVQRLRDAGMVMLGKANLSEWSNIRSGNSTSGWSAVGGLTRNAYNQERSACGSSAGSAVAVAASLAPVAVGTETDGSVVWPAAINGVVGLKPTLGLMPSQGIIPISHEQDAPGPLARNVLDAAMLLSAMTARQVDYEAGLADVSLKGVRLGAMRFLKNFADNTLAVFEHTLELLRRNGAIIVDIDDFDITPINDHLLNVLLTELKEGLNAYLCRAHPRITTRTLEDVIAFNTREPRELAWFGQELFERAAKTEGLNASAYKGARARIKDLAGPLGIDRLIRENCVSALIAPTNDPAWLIKLGDGDLMGGSSSTLPAVAGYPHLTVPAGYVDGLPVGVSFIGPAQSEQWLLGLGFSFEQLNSVRQPPRM